MQQQERKSETNSIEKWTKILKILKLKNIQQSAPDFFKASGGFSMAVKPYSDKTANGLTRAIQDFINFSGGYCNRVSTTGMMRKINGEMKWTHGSGRRGAADLRAICKGLSMDIEIKIGKDRMSEAQIKEMAKVTQAGGVYFVATSMPQFLEWWQGLGFEIPDPVWLGSNPSLSK